MGQRILSGTPFSPLNTATNASPSSGSDCRRNPSPSLGTNLIGDPERCVTINRPQGDSDLTGRPRCRAICSITGRPGNGHLPLLPTSQAIDVGNDAVCPRRDQLGQRRVNIPAWGPAAVTSARLSSQARTTARMRKTTSMTKSTTTQTLSPPSGPVIRRTRLLVGQASRGRAAGTTGAQKRTIAHASRESHGCRCSAL